MNVGIVGGGAWGQALATLTAKAGHEPRIGYRGQRPVGFPGTPNIERFPKKRRCCSSRYRQTALPKS